MMVEMAYWLEEPTLLAFWVGDRGDLRASMRRNTGVSSR